MTPRRETDFVKRIRAWQRLFAWPRLAPTLTVQEMAEERDMPLATMRRWVRDYVATGLLRPCAPYGSYELGDAGMALRDVMRRVGGGTSA